MITANGERKINMRAKRVLEVGQRVYEVFIYKVRTAVVTSVRTIRLDDPARTRVAVYEIKCDDGSVSPRYYESDVGVALFADPAEAEKKCEENKQYRCTTGPRESYIIKEIETIPGERRGAFAKGARYCARRAITNGKKAVYDGI